MKKVITDEMTEMEWDPANFIKIQNENTTIAIARHK